MTGPSVVAIGGGHGLSVTLRAASRFAGHVTGVVSTADDGGSTGRLREAWDGPAVGDVRRCLSALAEDRTVWARVLERRFDAGELEGHAVGNLLLLALTEELGDLQAACDEVARTAGLDIGCARVVPVTGRAVTLAGRTVRGELVEGQVSVATTVGIHEVWVQPEAAEASPVALGAVRGADLVVLGPGSLYTSVLAAAVVGELRKALADTSARVAYVANLRAEQAEARGYSVAEHVAALRRHEVHPDVVLTDPRASVELGEVAADVVSADISDDRGLLHSPDRLAIGLQSLLT